mgnify:CR=1 FL=1
MTIKRIINGKEEEIILTRFEENMIFEKVSKERMEQACNRYGNPELKTWD